MKTINLLIIGVLLGLSACANRETQSTIDPVAPVGSYLRPFPQGKSNKAIIEKLEGKVNPDYQDYIQLAILYAELGEETSKIKETVDKALQDSTGYATVTLSSVIKEGKDLMLSKEHFKWVSGKIFERSFLKNKEVKEGVPQRVLNAGEELVHFPKGDTTEEMIEVIEEKEVLKYQDYLQLALFYAMLDAPESKVDSLIGLALEADSERICEQLSFIQTEFPDIHIIEKYGKIVKNNLQRYECDQ